tara:strand:- start:1011 stop:1301 length:291 start_codon:yes stop_codon:yes gene_type:complete
MAKRGRKKQAPKFKVGDSVTVPKESGTWELVWYKDGDDTCAIQNNRSRMLVKVSQLKLASEDTDMIELPIPSTDKKWMKEARQYLDKIKTEGYEHN